MPCIIVRGKKPTMYQRQDDGRFVCTGRGVTAEGVTMRGAYTRWKNALGWAEMSDDEKRKRKAKGQILVPHLGSSGILQIERTNAAANLLKSE